MVDRLSLIMQLGALATDLALRGDDRAAGVVKDAAEMLFADKSAVDWIDTHRRRDRDRKPKKEGIPRNSTEKAEFQTASQGFSPTPPFPSSPEETKTTQRAAADGVYVESVENLTSLLAQRMGDAWVDVDAFLRRRDYATWAGWMKEMLNAMTTGKAMVADVALVCRDDAALARPIGSPKGFRVFLASAIAERSNPPAAPRSNGSNGKPTTKDNRAASVLSTIRGYIDVRQQPGQRAIRFIPRAKVEALGTDVYRAYEAIGGADRLLEATGEQFGFVLRDFTRELEALQHG